MDPRKGSRSQPFDLNAPWTAQTARRPQAPQAQLLGVKPGGLTQRTDLRRGAGHQNPLSFAI